MAVALAGLVFSQAQAAAPQIKRKLLKRKGFLVDRWHFDSVLDRRTESVTDFNSFSKFLHPHFKTRRRSRGLICWMQEIASRERVIEG